MNSYLTLFLMINNVCKIMRRIPAFQPPRITIITIVNPKIAINTQPASIFQINQECKNSTFATIIQNKKEDRAIRMAIKI